MVFIGLGPPQAGNFLDFGTICVDFKGDFDLKNQASRKKVYDPPLCLSQIRPQGGSHTLLYPLIEHGCRKLVVSVDSTPTRRERFPVLGFLEDQ